MSNTKRRGNNKSRVGKGGKSRGGKGGKSRGKGGKTKSRGFGSKRRGRSLKGGGNNIGGFISLFTLQTRDSFTGVKGDKSQTYATQQAKYLRDLIKTLFPANTQSIDTVSIEELNTAFSQVELPGGDFIWDNAIIPAVRIFIENYNEYKEGMHPDDLVTDKGEIFLGMLQTHKGTIMSEYSQGKIDTLLKGITWFKSAIESVLSEHKSQMAASEATEASGIENKKLHGFIQRVTPSDRYQYYTKEQYIQDAYARKSMLQALLKNIRNALSYIDLNKNYRAGKYNRGGYDKGNHTCDMASRYMDGICDLFKNRDDTLFTSAPDSADRREYSINSAKQIAYESGYNVTYIHLLFDNIIIPLINKMISGEAVDDNIDYNKLIDFMLSEKSTMSHGCAIPNLGR